jgi:hypothetical protein
MERITSLMKKDNKFEGLNTYSYNCSAYNTRLVLFGYSASAFAKAVAPAKGVYFCFANV